MGEGSTDTRGGIPTSFWLGAGIGFLLSTVAVIAATELTHRRGLRRRNGGYIQTEGDLVEDLSTAVQEGLHVLSEAAKQINYAFGDARRELVRFGLDLGADGGGVGGSGDAYYYEDEGNDEDSADASDAADARENSGEEIHAGD